MGGEVTLDLFTHIIFQCPQLQQLVIKNLTSESFQPVSLPESPVTFPHLSQLKIKLGEFDYDSVASMFSFMDLPALQILLVSREITLFEDQMHPPFPINSLLPSSSDSYPSLRRLSLAFADIDLPKLLSLLHASPLLEHLTLCLDSILPVPLFNALTPGNDGAPKLDYLSTFTFAFDAPNLTDDPHFDAIIVAFAKLVSTWLSQPKRRRPLAKVALYPCHEDDTDSPSGTLMEHDIRQRIGVDADITIAVGVIRYPTQLYNILNPIG
ncbi:hypothetical protein H0H93_001884 [Arthromyces matolae]|nr:hypothetical protein H0H93_001884 [Arthromyces matolae]